MRATYPAYLGRASEGLPVGEPARVPQGTIVDLSGRASTELRAIQLVSPKQSIALNPNGHSFTGRFVATQSAKWNWSAAGSLGPIADVPLPLELEVVPKIPTMEERRAMARDAADSAVREAQATASAQRSLQQRTDEASKDRGQRADGTRNGDTKASSDSKANGGQQNSMSYEAAEQARAVAKEQRALAERVKNLEQQAAALEQQLKQAGALDSALARQLREAQELLRQALTPELLEQMKKLEDAAHQLSGEGARQAMKDLAAMQQRLKEQLEKSAEMLKRAAFEGSMQTLKDEAKDIADRERKLADSAKASGNKRNDTQQDQAKQ